MTRRALTLFAAAALAACSGGSTPPAPVATPTPSDDDAGLQPLTSREGPGAGAAAPSGELPPGHPPLDSGTGGAPTAGPVASGAAVSGTVALSPQLAARASSGGVLYVMAKKEGATLAVQRIESPSFPMPFRVSEGHAMVAGTALEGPVEIVARLSKTGDAIPSAGDLEGAAGGVNVPSEGVAVTIDQVRQ